MVIWSHGEMPPEDEGIEEIPELEVIIEIEP